MTVVALIVSIISLFWSILNQRVQNFRWAKLNAAIIGIKEIRMLPFKEVTRKEAETIDLGVHSMYLFNRQTKLFCVAILFVYTRYPYGNVVGGVNTAEHRRLN